MRITKWGEYGILCCIYLARKGEGHSVGAAELAQHQAIPLQYTQQILQRLRRGGVIVSVRGPGGGYKLSRDAALIHLKDILCAAEGNTFEIICESKSIPCSRYDSDCVLQPVWRELKEKVDEVLESKSLASIIQSRGRVCSTPIAVEENCFAKGPAEAALQPNEQITPFAREIT